jgi:thiol-disulfide isomerase/thioredoxin
LDIIPPSPRFPGIIPDYNTAEGGEMRKLGTLMTVLALLWIGGCGKKETETEKAAPPVARDNRTHPAEAPPPSPAIHRFGIRDIDRRETRLEFSGDHTVFHRIHQPIVMIVLFADWCPPCRGMLPYLSRLQSENRDDLFVIGVLVHSDLDDGELRRLMERYETNFFISNHPDNDALGSYLAKRYELGENYPLPLTLIYKNGTYQMHISGAVPLEMLQSLVDQFKEKKKKKKD